MADFVLVERIDNQGKFYLAKQHIISIAQMQTESNVTEIVLNHDFFGKDPLNVHGNAKDIVEKFNT